MLLDRHTWSRPQHGVSVDYEDRYRESWWYMNKGAEIESHSCPEICSKNNWNSKDIQPASSSPDVFQSASSGSHLQWWGKRAHQMLLSLKEDSFPKKHLRIKPEKRSKFQISHLTNDSIKISQLHRFVWALIKLKTLHFYFRTFLWCQSFFIILICLWALN